MRILNTIVAVVLLLSAEHASGDESVPVTWSYGNWSAFKDVGDCWIASRPKRALAQNYTGPVFDVLALATWFGELNDPQLSFYLPDGFPGDPFIIVGDERREIFQEGEFFFLRGDDRRLINGILGVNNFQISNGDSIIEFSTFGFSEAWSWVSEHCRDDP